MEISYFFNADFEDFLASGEHVYKINSSRQNQELEYFILWLEEYALYTTKPYEKEFLHFLESIKKSKVFLTQDKKNTVLWCQKLDDIEKQKRLNSKLTSAKFAIQEKLAHPKTQIILTNEKIKSDFLYKDPLGVSGIGMWKGCEYKNKIEKRLKKTSLVAEPLLKRTFDISTCVIDNKDYYYQNHIDEQFQYKGSTLGLNFTDVSWFAKYEKDINTIKDYYQNLGIETPYSIDSFTYKEDGKEKIYSLSEVNARKTMGYIAIMLWQKYFSQFRYCSFKLINSKKILNLVSHDKIYKAFEGKVIPLSPYGNLFFTYIIAENSLHDLYELEDELLSTLFKNI